MAKWDVPSPALAGQGHFTGKRETVENPSWVTMVRLAGSKAIALHTSMNHVEDVAPARCPWSRREFSDQNVFDLDLFYPG